jgi:uncharacterized protein
MQTVLSNLSEIELALQAIQANKSLYLLEIPPDTKVLFRIDGLIVKISDTVFDLLKEAREGSVQEAVSSLERTHGPDEAADALEALVQLSQSTIVLHQPPPLRRPDPKAVEPAGILIMVTQTCNLACTYCYAGGGTYGSRTKLMPEEGALRAIEIMLDRAPSKKSFTVTLFGGEPLLNFPLVRRIVDHCQELQKVREVSFHFSMTTNGSIVTDEIIEFLKKHRFTLMISYDGLGQQKYRPLAGGEASDKLVEANLRRLADAGVPFQLRATVTRELATRENVEHLVQIGKSLGGKRVMTSSASSVKNAIFPSQEEISLDIQHSTELKNVYREITERNIQAAAHGSTEKTVFDPNYFVVRSLLEGKSVGLGRCGAGLGMSAVSTDGNVYPCHRFVGMKDYAIGTAAEGVDEEKVKGFFAAADAANHANCSVCFARQICGGFCFYNISDGTGGFVPPPVEECDSFRDSIKYAIATVLRLREFPAEVSQRYFENNQGT